MTSLFRRRDLLTGAALSLALAARRARAQAPGPMPEPMVADIPRARVGLMHGEDRRQNAYNALKAIDNEILAKLKNKTSVVIKPNNVSTVNQLAASHADGLRGILDYVSERFKGPIYLAESSAGDTMQGFENFKYTRLPAEYKNLTLVDLNAEAKYQILPVLDADLHLTPVRLAARLLDPDAFIINAGCLKTHNVTVATLSVKNMTLGAPLHQAPKETKRWNDKRKYHGGVRQTHYDMWLTAQKMAPYWGVSLLDGYEGMEGNGPSSGTPVPSKVAIASTDFIAADRIGVEAMGIEASHLGYLLYCWQTGIGQYDLSKIDIIGEELAKVRKPYRLHRDIELQLQWLGPMTDVPPKLG